MSHLLKPGHEIRYTVTRTIALPGIEVLSCTSHKPRHGRLASGWRHLMGMVIVLFGLVAMSACSRNHPGRSEPGDQQVTYEALIRRTEGGVPHIKADDFASLGFGTGHAMAEDNICILADQFLTFAAARSHFFGPDAGNLNSDFFYQLFIDRGRGQRSGRCATGRGVSRRCGRLQPLSARHGRRESLRPRLPGSSLGARDRGNRLAAHLAHELLLSGVAQSDRCRRTAGNGGGGEACIG